MLVLHGDEEEYVPDHIDKDQLIGTWKKACPHISPLSGVILGANHCVTNPEAQRVMGDRVIKFVETINQVDAESSSSK